MAYNTGQEGQTFRETYPVDEAPPNYASKAKAVVNDLGLLIEQMNQRREELEAKINILDMQMCDLRTEANMLDAALEVSKMPRPSRHG